jgi:threonine dehydratase
VTRGASPPTYEDIEDAARHIAGAALRTPVLTSRTVNARVGAEVVFKCENLQRGGAFKFRGAYNALSRLSPSERQRGVVAFSSGNHAQAVALAGRTLGIHAVVVMPLDASRVKRAATEEYGAEVVTYDRRREDRAAIGRRLAEERGLTLIPPFDHPHIIGGAGTAARELFEEVGPLDLLFVPCGGGGLLSGSALSASVLSPACRVVGVEPAAGDDGVRSFRTGELQTANDPQTIADGARTPSLGDLTFAIIRRHVAEMTSVDDRELLRSTFFLWERLKIVVEPTGALGAAALFRPGAAAGARRIGVLLSGGNVDFGEVAGWVSAL